MMDTEAAAIATFDFLNRSGPLKNCLMSPLITTTTNFALELSSVASSFLMDVRVSLSVEARTRSVKGAVSAQKAPHGSETETRELLGGMQENSVSPMRGH